MLVLSRQVDEWIMIGDDVLVGTTAIGADRVRLIVQSRVRGGADDGAPLLTTAELGVGESLQVAPYAVVEVWGIVPPKVRLGVGAPKEVSVHRKEVYDAIRRANEEHQ